MAVNKITGEIVDDDISKFTNEIANLEVNALITDDVLDMMERYSIAKAAYDSWIDAHDQQIMDIMKASGTKSIKTEYVTITYVAPTVRKSLDSKKLKEDCPDIYDKYLKESPVKESLRIKMKEVTND